ncbi:hypothetical protein [Niveibacterium sp. COAC-50]|uniref:hypothetical protein n=1 Tax=Niveibacterium sp. COAC-50 TaxID=2729384 RepID=UPI0015571EA1|nr:hypothetical protein [Niveibacterium sp. COAC-50]
MVDALRGTEHVRALAAAIQRAVAQRQPRAQRRASAKVRGQTPRANTALAGLIDRARAIDPQNPQREQLALRLFIEGVLIAELGERIALEPAFAQLVRDVEDTLRATPAIQADLRRAAQALTSPDTET